MLQQFCGQCEIEMLYVRNYGWLALYVCPRCGIRREVPLTAIVEKEEKDA